MKNKLILTFFSWFALYSILWVDSVYAYLDPGMGSMLFGYIVAAISGGVFIIKTYWSSFKKKLSTKKKK
jgi:hypothetical protein